MKKWLVAILFGTLLVLGACGGDDGGSSGDSGEAVAEGESLYKKSCAGCHGNDLTGTSGPDISKVGASLSEEEIQDVIENGVGTMPAGIYTGDQAKEVAEWLATKK